MMNHKPETSMYDEEKSFEVIQEGESKDFTTPHIVKRGLTEVSAMFDRNGKGYLDETERALRRMDSQDRGFLGIDKVCVIFESLQTEQERSSQLLEALRIESKKSLNLKKGVIALSVFTILLALANVGTSFAVSKLVKDTQISHGDLIVKGGATRVGTTSKTVVFHMNSLDGEERRRRLSDRQLSNILGLVCPTTATPMADGTTQKECGLAGEIDNEVAEDLYEQLQSVDKILLDCNSVKTEIAGGIHLSGTPSVVDMGSPHMVYPDGANTDNKYDATEEVPVPEQPYVPANGTQPEIPFRAAYDCIAEFEMAMYCPTDLVDGKLPKCWVMWAYDPTLPGNCPVLPEVCGPAPTPSPPIA